MAYLVQDYRKLTCQHKTILPLLYTNIHLNHSCQHELVNIESSGVAEVKNQRKAETIRALVEILLIC